MNFTIITASLNYGRFIADCLQSVAGQEGVELEHLVIDGGSGDDTAKVVSRFGHVTWLQESDDGLSDAINKGFDRARGEWVMWLNADDRLKPGELRNVLARLRNSEADVVYGGWDFIDEDGRHLRHVKAPRWSRFVHVHHHCFVGSTAAFYRKSSVIDAGHRLRVDFKYAMDSEFYARLDAAGLSFQAMDLAIADFRLHGENLSQRNHGRSSDISDNLAAEYQFAESRAVRRTYGITLFKDPYLNGLVDGFLWIAAKAYKALLRASKH